MPKTAEQMNQERRLVKARQHANARARAAQKTDNGVFDAQEAMRERRRFQIRQQRAKANGEAWLAKVKAQGSLLLGAPDPDNFDDFSDEYSDARKQWVRDCRDVIAAAKADDSIRYYWNKEWELECKLVIGIPKQQKRVA